MAGHSLREIAAAEHCPLARIQREIDMAKSRLASHFAVRQGTGRAPAGHRRAARAAAGTTAMDWVHFRLLAPAWESLASPAFATSLPTLRRGAQALGVTLFKGLTVYSPWFSRRANAATFLAQTVARVGATCTITVQTKLASDIETGNITDLANTITCNAVGTTSARNADLKELVRFKYVLTGTNSTDWIHFLVLEPQWENN